METAKNTKLEVLPTPFCGDLRSKKFYMNDAIITNAQDYMDSSGHTWCYHTQMPVGPDGNWVAPEQCIPGRRCYRSALAEPQPFVVMKPEKNAENPEI